MRSRPCRAAIGRSCRQSCRRSFTGNSPATASPSGTSAAAKARARMPGEYGSTEFLAAYDALLGGRAKAQKSPPTGTFAWGLSLYRQSQVWGALSPATRRQRDNIFARVARTHGETPLSAWKRGDIAAGRDKRAATPAAARHFVESLRGLFRWLVESGLVASDPTAGVRVVKAERGEGFAPWTADDEAAF